jgi:RNA polymerase sigma-70 factor, ECF subfamily
MLSRLAEPDSRTSPATNGRGLNSQSEPLRKSLLGLIPNLRAFAVSLCGDIEHADDLVQETLFKAWDHIESFQEGTNLRAWLFTILRNTYFSECRRRHRELQDPDGSKAAALAVYPNQDAHIDMEDLRTALDLLAPEQREALTLVAAAGFSYEEAAAISGCAVGTIKSRVNRARCKLVDLLGVAGAGDYRPDRAMEAIVNRRVGGRLLAQR